MAGLEPSKLMMRVRSSSSAPVLAASNLGECTALLTRRARFDSGAASHLPACSGEQRGLQTREGEFDSAPPAPIRRVSQVGRARSCNLRDIRSIRIPYSMVRLVNQRTRRSVTAKKWGQHPYLTPARLA